MPLEPRVLGFADTYEPDDVVADVDTPGDGDVGDAERRDSGAAAVRLPAAMSWQCLQYPASRRRTTLRWGLAAGGSHRRVGATPIGRGLGPYGG